jgi:hypothetical protein
MLCILRVIVDRDEFDELQSGLGIIPYRIDRDTPSDPARVVAHYDVLDSDAPFEQSLARVLEFLEAHKLDVESLSKSGSNYLELDLAVDVSSDKYASNLRLGPGTISALAGYKISLNFAIYQTSESDNK